MVSQPKFERKSHVSRQVGQADLSALSEGTNVGRCSWRPDAPQIMLVPSKGRSFRRLSRVRSARTAGERAAAREALRLLKRGDDQRTEFVASIRTAIESGTYDEAAKLEFAVDRLLAEIGPIGQVSA